MAIINYHLQTLTNPFISLILIANLILGIFRGYDSTTLPESLNSAVPARVHTVNQRPAHKGKETQQESGRKGATFALRCGQLAELWWIEHDVETRRNHS